jgi:hypothetical protein
VKFLRQVLLLLLKRKYRQIIITRDHFSRKSAPCTFLCPAFSLSIKHILRFVFLQGTVDLRQKKKKEKEKTLTFEALVPRVVVLKNGVVLKKTNLIYDLF